MTHSTAARQAERTTLAWTRTSFAFLGNGALLVIVVTVVAPLGQRA